MSHKYLVSAAGSGVVVHETPEAGNSRRRHYVVVTDDGTLTTIPFVDLDGDPPLVEDRDGDHPYRVVEHDRSEWVKWPGSVHQSPLYLDIHGPGGWHARLLWDTVGFPWVPLQNQQRWETTR